MLADFLKELGGFILLLHDRGHSTEGGTLGVLTSVILLPNLRR